MTRLHKLAPDIAATITDHRKIRSFRNIIVHSYDAIDDETTRDVVAHKLPVLRADVTRLMTSP